MGNTSLSTSAVSVGGHSQKGILPTPVEDKRKPDQKPPWEDRLVSLRSQRKAMGECFKCGDKFQLGHKCAKSVPLHVVEELLQVMQSGSDSDSEDSSFDSSDSESLMMLSAHATAGTTHSKSIRLQGTVQGKQVLILVDSGSTGSFISQYAADQLALLVAKVSKVTVTVADGGKTLCDTAVPLVKWQCQGNSFVTTLRVFPILGYDMILGMDWLDAIGKMWIDWHRKKLRFKHAGVRITLRGIRDDISQCKHISQEELAQIMHDRAIAQVVQLCPVDIHDKDQPVPEPVIQLLDRHLDCFQEPKTLPPHRPYDHAINLLPGVQPVNVKPYHYTPQQKDKIEKQVRECCATASFDQAAVPLDRRCCW
jgi:hypothetical protein